jgi:excisionase family DNA binding protein
MSNLLSVAEVSRELGVSVRRVQAMITAGRLRAERVGSVYVIHAAALAAVRVRRPGRPRGSRRRSQGTPR